MSEPVEQASDAAPGGAPAAPPRRRRTGSFWRELPILVVVALVLAILIKTFLVQAFYIPSASMENTLQGGAIVNGQNVSTSAHPYDRILVDKVLYDFRDPHRGEIVVFSQPKQVTPGYEAWPDESPPVPSNPVLRFFHDIGTLVGLSPSSSSDFVKRVIGIPGDTVSCLHDTLRVNGHVLDEPFVYPGNPVCDSINHFGGRTIHVPSGELWVMGDHRADSDDSRLYGFVPESDVIGKASVVIWPPKDWKTLPVPSTFQQPGLSTMGSEGSAVPGLAAGVVVVPVAGWRWRRHRRRRKARI